MIDSRGRQYDLWLTQLLDIEDEECFQRNLKYNLMTLRGCARNGILHNLRNEEGSQNV